LLIDLSKASYPKASELVKESYLLPREEFDYIDRNLLASFAEPFTETMYGGLQSYQSEPFNGSTLSSLETLDLNLCTEQYRQGSYAVLGLGCSGGSEPSLISGQAVGARERRR
jgi:hypothetical protein